MKDTIIGLVILIVALVVIATALELVGVDAGNPLINKDDPCLTQKCD